MSALDPITDHEARALSRTRLQFRSSVEMLGIIAALAREVQAIEDALNGLASAIRADPLTATGDALDRIGELLGAPIRGDRVDAWFKLFVETQRLTNVAFGDPDRLLTLCSSLAGIALQIRDGLEGWNPSNGFGSVGGTTVALIEPSGLGDTMNAEGANAEIYFLREAAPAGVRVILGFDESSQPFQLDTNSLDDYFFYNAIDRVQG